jgi:hypothetical protein
MPRALIISMVTNYQFFGTLRPRVQILAERETAHRWVSRKQIPSQYFIDHFGGQAVLIRWSEEKKSW